MSRKQEDNMSKDYTPQEDWYLAMLLEDCDYAIEAEEDFADGGPSPDDIRSLIMELQERRGIKMKVCSSCHLGGGDIVRKCLDCKGEGFIKEKTVSNEAQQKQVCKDCGFHHPGGTCLDS